MSKRRRRTRLWTYLTRSPRFVCSCVRVCVQVEAFVTIRVCCTNPSGRPTVPPSHRPTAPTSQRPSHLPPHVCFPFPFPVWCHPRGERQPTHRYGGHPRLRQDRCGNRCARQCIADREGGAIYSHSRAGMSRACDATVVFKKKHEPLTGDCNYFILTVSNFGTSMSATQLFFNPSPHAPPSEPIDHT
jgi:hypothetical protein